MAVAAGRCCLLGCRPWKGETGQEPAGRSVGYGAGGGEPACVAAAAVRGRGAEDLSRVLCGGRGVGDSPARVFPQGRDEAGRSRELVQVVVLYLEAEKQGLGSDP